MQTHDAPLGEDAGPEALVDGDGRRIPFENIPLKARTALLNGNLRESYKKRFADSPASQRWRDIEVFQPDAMVATPGGVAREIKSEASGRAVMLSDKSPETRRRPEAVAQEVCFGGDNGIRFALIEGQLVNEAEDRGNVSRRGGTDGHMGSEQRVEKA